MICEICGETLIFQKHTSEIVWKCPKCGWAEATTYIDPIYEDETVYSVVLHISDDITKEKLKVVSRIVGCNFIKAKSLLMHEGSVLVEDKATTIKETAALLKECKIEFDITPEFIYEY